MTIKVVVHRVCDRCQSDFEGQSVKYDAGLPKILSKKIAAAITEGEKSTVLFLFEDLCPDCERVVDGYVRRIRMEEPEDSADSKPKKAKKSAKTPDAVAPVTTETSSKETRFEPLETPAVTLQEVSVVAAPIESEPQALVELSSTGAVPPASPAVTAHPF